MIAVSVGQAAALIRRRRVLKSNVFFSQYLCILCVFRPLYSRLHIFLVETIFACFAFFVIHRHPLLILLTLVP